MKTIGSLLLPTVLTLAMVSLGCDDEGQRNGSGTSCDEDPRNKCSRINPREHPDPSEDMEIALECGDVQREAYKLLRESQRCDSDSDCVVESVAARCLTAFLCPVAVSRSTDLVSIRQQALALTLEHQRCSLTKTSGCPIAKCWTPTQADVGCNPSTKLCAPRTTFDASVPTADAGSDASTLPFESMDASSDAASNPAGDAAQPDVCPSLDAQACLSTSTCFALQARRYDTTQRCREERAFAGCVSGTNGCTQAVTYANDPAGRSWEFSSGCQPQGWSSIMPALSSRPSEDWPICPASRD